jgi:prepilin-type N-terminal cleavage/methylation domain-containing protein
LSAGRACRHSGARGFSLVELLVAASLGCLVLGLAWPWCWQVCRAWRGAAPGAEAASTLAAVRRVTLSEVPQAVALLNAPDTGCTRTTLAFAAPSGSGAAAIVTYVWDAGRGVLWRKAPGSHLAEQVTAFGIEYFDGRGRPLALDGSGRLPAGSLAEVRRLTFTVAVAGASSLTWDVALGCGA